MKARLNKIRRAIANSPRVNRWLERNLARYIAWCHRTSRWECDGLDEMMALARAGEPVIFVLWHQRLLMTPYLFDTAQAPFSTLTADSRAGRLAGNIFKHFDFDTVAMASYKTHLTLSREVMRRHGEGQTLGIAADGPRGPIFQCSAVPVMWARTTQSRVFCAAYAQKRMLPLPTWDKLAVPLPWTRGCLVVEEWTEKVPKRPTDAEMVAYRRSMKRHLDHVTRRADIGAGRQTLPEAELGVTATSR